MLDEYGFEVYEENAFPVAYLLTWRTFGTWLPGDERGAIQRSRDHRFRTVHISSNVPLEEAMHAELKQSVILLDQKQRDVVSASIHEVCRYRSYSLHASNVRSNHAHVVASKAIKPEKIVNDLKAYATRRLRDERLIGRTGKVWARGASTRYLWKPRHLSAAIEYVLYSQGDIPRGTILDLPEDFG